MKSYRKWGDPTIIDQQMKPFKCFIVEDQNELTNPTEEVTCGIGSVAVVSSTNKAYYLSYEDKWKPWGEGNKLAIEFVDDGSRITLQKTWSEIKELFDTGIQLYIGEQVVNNVISYTEQENGNIYYLVLSNNSEYTYYTDLQNGYPQRYKRGPK